MKVGYLVWAGIDVHKLATVVEVLATWVANVSGLGNVNNRKLGKRIPPTRRIAPAKKIRENLFEVLPVLMNHLIYTGIETPYYFVATRRMFNAF